MLNKNSTIQFYLKGRRLEAKGRENLTSEEREQLGIYERTLLDGIEDQKQKRAIGYVILPSASFVDIDDFETGYVDLQDLKRTDNISFQSSIIHITVERFATENYEEKSIKNTFDRDALGENLDYKKGHAEAHKAEVEFLKEKFPSLANKINYPKEGFINQYFFDKNGDAFIKVYKDFGGVQFVLEFPVFPTKNPDTYRRKSSDEHLIRKYVQF